MAFTPKDPVLADHLAWLGYVQPEGLVVSAPALVDAQVVIDRAQLGSLQRRFAEHVTDLPLADSDTAETAAGVAEIPRLFTEFLEWQDDLIVGWDPSRPLPETLSVSLPEFQETLRPSYAVANPHAKEGASPWLLLVQSHSSKTDLDRPAASSARGWPASPAKKFERLLRETGVSVGLLTNGVEFRLVYAPPKENSGTLRFKVGEMNEVSGRLILGAFHLLLNSWTLFTAPSEARLPALLQRSRDYQASVSEVLAEQVLHALYELLRGFEAADGRVKGALLRELAAKDPHNIYGGLVTVLLRLVFTLFAEDRGLLPLSGLYVRHYSVRGLFERLRNDAEQYPDTMDHRFGAWPQLLALFRIIHGGCEYSEIKMPARAGHLFDPDRYPFLEGRASLRDPVGALPLVSDGTLHRILEKLCILEGERVSYRTLDVEEIGSVYQTIMGFDVETASGRSIALKGKRKNGGVPASPIINLEQLLSVPAKDRGKWLKENADTELSGEADKRLKSAESVDDLLVALERRIDRDATPGPVAKGGLVLQPGDERRRSGSHYTPRSFTEPIVRKTLGPILTRFGEQPTSGQILDLRICDIAVGSAAFLVETCRQLADVLVRAWRTQGGRPQLPPDETEELLAMRLIAQRCLYGVDRNPMAVDLAKLSLWLTTLAKDHPFTFLDHNIRCGDSVVGLTAEQIASFTWTAPRKHEQIQLIRAFLEHRIKSATSYRREILDGGDFVLPSLKAAKLQLADEALDEVRFVGDLIISAFFSSERDKARRQQLETLRERYIACHTSKSFDPELKPREAVQELRRGDKPVYPFHWQVEFPEVFGRENGGFDAVVGNPPFAGKNTILGGNRGGYIEWLKTLNEESHGNADLVAHFFRRAFSMLRRDGTLGLIATNTICQGDTRQSGLRWICVKGGGTIYAARRRYKWVGTAAVVVSVVWICRGTIAGPFDLDGNSARIITAYLFHDGGHESPVVLNSNAEKSFQGSILLGMGFTFDDTDTKGVASTLSEMNELIKRNPRNAERIFPYIGGEEVNESADHRPIRYTINFFDLSLEAAGKWPDLLEIVRRKVKPDRDGQDRDANRERWWQYAEKRPGLYRALEGKANALVCCRHQPNWSVARLAATAVFAESLIVFPFGTNAAFCALQSRPHEIWARFFGSSMKDDLRYTPTDCFETFPFLPDFETNAALESVGREYYEFRAQLMRRANQGLTETYNQFHDPGEVSKEIIELRELHSAMDRAVLSGYGWTDIPTACEFIPDFFDLSPDGTSIPKSIRYRWPDAIRDEVLARLLRLNAERAVEERHSGAVGTITETNTAKKVAAAKRPRKPKPQVAVELPLPTDFRLSFQNPLLYSVSLVASLLSEAGGSLPWAQLLDAFVLVTDPKLLVRLAAKEDAELAKAWAARWNEAAKSEMLIPALRHLGGNNLAVERSNGTLTFALQDGPRAHASEDMAYDAWLALRVARSLAPQAVPIPMRAAWTKQAESVLVA